jgi:hypothetical protein
MTIRIPKKNILDRILLIIGKERDIVIPGEAGKIYEKYGPYVYIKAKRESFWKALLRKKARTPLDHFP